MSMKQAEPLVREITVGQWGMISTRQASAVGVSRLDLSRLEKAGKLERMSTGIYRQTAAPQSQYDNVRAAWLSTEPETLAWKRYDEPSVIVGSSTAAWLHRIGDLQPEPYEFFSTTRRQSARDDVHFRQRTIASNELRIVEGLPATSVEQTIADLLQDVGDVSLVGAAFRDAATSGREPDRGRMEPMLAGLAKRYGFAPGNGGQVYDMLAVEAGTDPESVFVRYANQVDLQPYIDESVRKFMDEAVRKALAENKEWSEMLQRLGADVPRALSSGKVSRPDAG